jgi:hypothetical protein
VHLPSDLFPPDFLNQTFLSISFLPISVICPADLMHHLIAL